MNAEGAGRQHFAVGHAVEFQGGAFADHAWIGDMATQFDEPLQQQRGIGFVR